MTKKTVIDLIRHGEPVGGRRYRGQIDDPLSEVGWQQMWATVQGHAPWQHIVTSPMQRCRAFAQALGEKHSLDVEEDARFKEVGFGSWEGRTADDIRREDPQRIARFYHDPVGHRPQDAEPLHDFARRVGQGLDDLLERYQGRHVLVVAHAGVIRAILTQVLGAPFESMYRIHVETASLTRVETDGERPLTVVFVGGKSL